MTPLMRSVLLFIVAGLMEIGGGYLVWQWLRHSRSALVGVTGALLLALYGVVATYQPANFGRIYAAYGGVFTATALKPWTRFTGVVPCGWLWCGVSRTTPGSGNPGTTVDTNRSEEL